MLCEALLHKPQFPTQFVSIFLKLNYCVNLYYGTNSDNTALNDKTFINFNWIMIWLQFLSVEVLWSVRISGVQYRSQYISDSSSRFFTFRQNKRILIFIINLWTVSCSTHAEAKIQSVIHPGDTWKPYSQPELLNQILYKLYKDTFCALKSLIFQSSLSSWRQSKMLQIPVM